MIVLSFIQAIRTGSGQDAHRDMPGHQRGRSRDIGGAGRDTHRDPMRTAKGGRRSRTSARRKPRPPPSPITRALSRTRHEHGTRVPGRADPCDDECWRAERHRCASYAHAARSAESDRRSIRYRWVPPLLVYSVSGPMRIQAHLTRNLFAFSHAADSIRWPVVRSQCARRTRPQHAALSE